MQVHEDRNSRLDFKHSNNLMRDYHAESFALFIASNQAYLIDEVWEPLYEQPRTMSVVAIEERLWPPKGVGARVIRCFVSAVVSDDGQAIVTPGLLHPAEVTNIGLACALTKYFLETLRDQKIQ